MKYELLIKSGTVIDPARNVHAPAAAADVRGLRDRESEPDLRARHAFLVQDDDVIGRILGDRQVQEVDPAIAVDIKDIEGRLEGGNVA